MLLGKTVGDCAACNLCPCRLQHQPVEKNRFSTTQIYWVALGLCGFNQDIQWTLLYLSDAVYAARFEMSVSLKPADMPHIIALCAPIFSLLRYFFSFISMAAAVCPASVGPIPPCPLAPWQAIQVAYLAFPAFTSAAIAGVMKRTDSANAVNVFTLVSFFKNSCWQGQSYKYVLNAQCAHKHAMDWSQSLRRHVLLCRQYRNRYAHQPSTPSF